MLISLYLTLCSLQIEKSEDIDTEMDGIIQAQQDKHPHQILHAVAYY